jgi:hypothetical protein
MEVAMPKLILSIFVLTFLVGCSPYHDDYQYVPHPALAEIPTTQPAQGPPLSAYASIVGVRYDDPQAQIPESVEVALQLNNNGPQTVTFNPRSFALSDGKLSAFMPPLLYPPTSATLAPGQSTNYTVYFPFPPGQDYTSMDLNSLQLRWSVQLDNRSVSQIVMFRRSIRYYYSDPYYYGYPYPYGYPYYGGVVIVGGGRRWR